jgi:hypothetical protein
METNTYTITKDEMKFEFIMFKEEEPKKVPLLSTKDNKVLHNSAKKVNRAIWS